MRKFTSGQKRPQFGFALLLIFTIGLFASSCGRATLLPSTFPVQTSVTVITPKSSHTPAITVTLSPSATLASTKTPTPVPIDTLIPTKTITLSIGYQVASHKLSLNEKNVATNLEQLKRLGKGMLYDVEWSPDGKFLAVATGLGIWLYDPLTYEQIRLIDTNSAATKIAFGPDSSTLAVARDNLVSVWEVKTGQKLVDMEGEIQGGVWKLVYGNGGHVAAFGQSHRGAGEAVPVFKIWRTSTGKQLRSVNNIMGWTVAVDISPDGKKIAYYGEDGLAVRDLRSDEKIAALDGHFDVVFSPDDNNKIFTSIWDWYDTGKVFAHKMIDTDSGQTTDILEKAECQYLSRTGKSIICYGSTTIVVFDPNSGEQIHSISYPDEISDASISPDGHYLAVKSNNRVKVLEFGTGQELKTIEFDTFDRFSVGQTEMNGRASYVVATSSEKGPIHIWDLENGILLRDLQDGEEEFNALEFSPDRTTLASIDKLGIVKLWNLQNGEVTNSYFLGGQKVDGPLVFNPSGNKLAMTDSSQENTYELDLQSGTLVKMGGNPTGLSYAYTIPYGWYTYKTNGHLMSWSQDSSHLIFVDRYSNETVELPYSKKTDDWSFFEAVAISKDSSYLAAGHTGAEIVVWDLKNQKQMKTMVGHTARNADGWMGAIRHLAFSPQNDLLLSIGWDGTTRLWNIQTGNLLKTFNVCCFAEFTPNGRVLVTAGEGVINVWGIPPWP